MVVVAVGFWWVLSPAPAGKSAVEMATVERGDLSVELPATGSIDAVNVVEVGSPISGLVAEIYKDFNQPVKAGELLARLDESDYRATWVQAEADLTGAKAAVAVAEAALQAALGDQKRLAAASERVSAQYNQWQAEWERQKKLLAGGLATQSQYDKIEAAFLNAKADLASAGAQQEQAAARANMARAGIEQARADVDRRTARASQAKRNLDYCRITSPVDGVVVSRDVDVGQTIAARLSAPPLFHIAEDLTKMYVYTKLDSSDVGKVRRGLAATFTVNAFPNEVFEGQVVEVRINPNPQAPVSRATPVGQFQRSITAGVTAGGDTSSELSASASAAAGGAGGSRGGSSGGSSSGSSGGSSGLPGTTATANAASSPPPEAKRNTVVVYDALIEFRNPERKLLPGMTAYVTIPLQSVKGKLKVPNAALRFTPNLPDAERRRLLESAGARDGSAVVWVIDEPNKYRPVAVKPVLTDYVFTAVESPELQPGMLVAMRM